MHNAVAQLFLDDSRAALNASFTTAALNTSVATSRACRPSSYSSATHSVAALRPASAVITPRVWWHAAPTARTHPTSWPVSTLLDAVPFSPIMPNAMARMKSLEESNDGDPADYIPVYEIGAPLNFLNAKSAVNEELSDARPGKFNGVVVDGGVHMDGMLGANPLIQASAYLVAGIPRRRIRLPCSR